MAEAYTAVRLSALRKVIAARMTEAKRTIPHFRIVADIELDALLALRKQFGAQPPHAKPSLNDWIIKACATALMKHPALNVQLIDDELRHFPQADVSVVIALDGGLATPVIRGADLKTVQDIAGEVKTLAARAIAGELKMDEIFGGSFSISNLGSYGADQFDAIINPPQCAILAVGRAKLRLVAATEHTTRIATVMRVTLSLDHRAIDGAAGARFLSTLRELLERPASMVA